jgi:hypothetical protein
MNEMIMNVINVTFYISATLSIFTLIKLGTKYVRMKKEIKKKYWRL